MTEKTVCVNYFGGIDMTRANLIMTVCSNLVANQKPDSLYFNFSSPCGDVSSGIVLYNFLKALPAKIIMHNMGSIDSIGIVVFLAGEERYAAKHSTFLFHGVAMNLSIGLSANLGRMQELTSQLEQDQNKIAGIIEENTIITQEEIRKLYIQGEAKDLAFARDKKLVHDIRDASIPRDASFVTINPGG